MRRSMRRRRSPGWVWAPLIALPLLMLSTCVPGKHLVDSALERKARSALAVAKLTDVKVDFDWGKGVLTGPAERKDLALAFVGASLDNHKRYALRYVADGSTPTPASTTTASPTTAAPAVTTSSAPATTAAPTTTTVVRTTTTTVPLTSTTVAAAALGVDATSDVNGAQIVLKGQVATQDQKAAVVAAAAAAFGATRVVDQLVVAGAAPTAGTNEAVKRYAALLGTLGPRLSTGSASIKDTVITVKGTGFNTQAVTEMNAAVQQANGNGVTATGTLTAAASDPAQIQAQLTALLGRSGINFAPDSADIDAGSVPILDTAAASIVALPNVKIAIGGHTDNAGSASPNQTLSQRRAEAVQAYLVSKGVNAAQLTAQGFGSSQPIADNSTPEGRAANRRIEFAVTGS